MRSMLVLSIAALQFAAACGDDGDISRRTDARVVYDGGSRDATFPPLDAPGADSSCENLRIASEAVSVNMMVVLDSSGSMYRPTLVPPVDRWTPAVMAVENVTAALDTQIQFGLMLFPSDDQCGAGTVEVAPGVGTASMISTVLSADPADLTGGGTPTAASLQLAGDQLATLDGDKFILLVTDGAPACNDTLDGTTCTCLVDPTLCATENRNCLDDVQTVSTIETIAAAGVQTYVVGFDTSMWASVLTEMAVAGGTGMTSYIEVSDGTALEAALDGLTRSVVSCTYDLESPPGDIRYVRVTVDGTTVDHESVMMNGNGWQLVGDRTIELIGDACTMIQDGEAHEVGITVECEPVILI